MFEAQVDTDLTIFSKEEHPIPVHTLVMQARCKKILNDVITEIGDDGKPRKIISFDSISKKVCIGFVR